jgi:1,4-dihydroxy-6-naphthoate synthase
MQKLSIGFSPCPNDTFIFDAMIHQRIDTEGLEFEVLMADVEELNQRATRTDLDITKLSYHAFAYLTDAYQLLNAGSALGNNCGPLLIAREDIPLDRVQDLHIAIPGKLTTAHFLMNLAFPQVRQKTEMLFSEIEKAVLDGKVDAGLIIHENRFTYAAKGLKKLLDLGEFWESTTQMPIPLGGIVIRRALPDELKQKVDRVIRRSVEYAWANPTASEAFVAKHAQEMDPKVRQQHIDLYVNQYSADLGEKGRSAVELLFSTAQQKGLLQAGIQALFVAQ